MLRGAQAKPWPSRAITTRTEVRCEEKTGFTDDDYIVDTYGLNDRYE